MRMKAARGGKYNGRKFAKGDELDVQPDDVVAMLEAGFAEHIDDEPETFKEPELDELIDELDESEE